MKQAFKLSLVAVAISVMSACGNAEEPKQVEIKTEVDKQSYALGMSMGNFIKANLDKNNEVGINLKQEMILGGIDDALAGTVQLSEEELKTVIQGLEAQVREKVTAQQEKDAEAAKQAGIDFLAENAKREGVVVTDSGLQYQVLTAAEGDKPSETDTVTVHYHGTLIDGTVFDSSVDRGQTASFPLNRVIPGWTEGLQYMNVGSKYKFFIPSELAYGGRNAGKIAPHSTLIFEVELFSIDKP